VDLGGSDIQLDPSPSNPFTSLEVTVHGEVLILAKWHKCGMEYALRGSVKNVAVQVRF
jgi:hypothetical protein